LSSPYLQASKKASRPRYHNPSSIGRNPIGRPSSGIELSRLETVLNEFLHIYKVSSQPKFEKSQTNQRSRAPYRKSKASSIEEQFQQIEHLPETLQSF
jgi:hypothetical protein